MNQMLQHQKKCREIFLYLVYFYLFFVCFFLFVFFFPRHNLFCCFLFFLCHHKNQHLIWRSGKYTKYIYDVSVPFSLCLSVCYAFLSVFFSFFSSSASEDPLNKQHIKQEILKKLYQILCDTGTC